MVALVASSRRGAQLRMHRGRLAREELEDCYSQAVLELLLAARAGRSFSNAKHIANALSQRFVSRIQDRQRAMAGRSPIEAALSVALPVGRAEAGEVEPADARADVERIVEDRWCLGALKEAFPGLSADQRFVLRNQVSGELSVRELCQRQGWSLESHRKIAQRGRARLRRLVEDCPGWGEGVG